MAKRYLLQAGAFANESEAENLKAQISLFAGMEARFVRSANCRTKASRYTGQPRPVKL
jgi:cell division protein FtsN